MTILYDHQAFQMQEYGGISKVYCEMIPLLKKYCNCNISVKYSNNQYLHNTHIVKGIKYLKKYNIPFLSKLSLYQTDFVQRIVYNKNRNKTISIRSLKKQQFDVFEPTFFDPYFLDYLNGKPFVLQIHDMIPELFPMYFEKQHPQIINKRILSPLAAHIHTPSQKTKDDLVNILNIDPSKITVIPHGWSPLPTPNTDRPINHPYILFIGERSGYKNFSKALHEFTIIKQKEGDLHLICTGKDFSIDEIKEISQIGLTDSIHHFYASESMLSTMYYHAEAFIYPSAYEGFGLPILEAWSLDCPVFLNNASCFPEIAGDAAVYFDIEQTGDLAEKMISFLHSSEKDKLKLITKQSNRLKLYSWDKTAQLLYEMYSRI